MLTYRVLRSLQTCLKSFGREFSRTATCSSVRHDLDDDDDGKFGGVAGLQNARFKPMPTSGEDWRRLLEEPSESPEGSRLLNVAVLGAPNAGKSTFVNALMGSKVRFSITSTKARNVERKVLFVLQLP